VCTCTLQVLLDEGEVWKRTQTRQIKGATKYIRARSKTGTSSWERSKLHSKLNRPICASFARIRGDKQPCNISWDLQNMVTCTSHLKWIFRKRRPAYAVLTIGRLCLFVVFFSSACKHKNTIQEQIQQILTMKCYLQQ
jgi:hypothetical protein